MYDTIGPRTIRFKSIIPELCKNNNLRIRILKLPINKSLSDYEINVEVPKHLQFTFLSNNWVQKVFSYISSVFILPDIKILLIKSFLKKIELEISTNTNITVIITRPFSFYLFGYFLKKKFPSIRTILDMGDPFYNNSADSKNYVYKKYFEAFCLKYYDDLIVTNELMKDFIVNTYKYPKENIHIIPQGGKKVKQAVERNENIKLNTSISLVYAGAFYKKLREPNNYLNAINEISEVSIKTTFIGVSKNWIEGYKNVVLIERVTNDIVYKYYDECDIILFFANQYGIQTSGKIYELLIVNKPLLIISNKDRFFLFEDYIKFPGVFLVENSKESIKRFFYEIKDTIVNCDRSMYQDKFSWENRSKLYEKVLLKKT